MTSDKINIKTMKNIFLKFDKTYFNNLNLDKRTDIVLDLINNIINQFGIPSIDKSSVLFVDKTKLSEISAGYEPNKKEMILNKDLLNKNHTDNIDLYFLLENILHETMHLIQDFQNSYQSLYNVIGKPYYIFQKHEQDAYNSTKNLMQQLRKIFNNSEFDMVVNFIENQINSREISSRQDLKSRNYATDKFSIQKQISQILPFYENYHKFLKLEKDEDAEKSIIAHNNTKITIIKDNDSWHCNISISKNNNTNDLYCSINSLCKISEIHKNTNNDDLPVPLNEKEELMIILNKIIDIYNERHIDKCSRIEIMPISLFENRKDYEQFLQQKHQITKPIEDLNSSLIPLDKIKRQCLFDTLEEQIKSNTSKEEAKEINQPNKEKLNR